MNADIKLNENESENLKEELKVFELDKLINEGVNAKIPFTFIYPNTDKEVGVMVRPLSANEYQTALVKSKKFKTNFLVEILKIALYNMEGEPFTDDLIEQIPSGVAVIIANEISRISGVEMVENIGVNQENLIEDLMGF